MRLHERRHEQLQVDVREVALLDPGHGWHLAVRAHHVLCDQASNAAERLAPPFFDMPGPDPGRSGSALCRGPDVGFRDPALRARPFEGIEVDAELLRDAAHQRGRTDTSALDLPGSDPGRVC